MPLRIEAERLILTPEEPSDAEWLTTDPRVRNAPPMARIGPDLEHDAPPTTLRDSVAASWACKRSGNLPTFAN